MAKHQEVAKAASTAVEVPDYLKGKEKTHGLKNMGVDDIVVPRVKLLQDAKREPATFNDAKLGEFWLNVLDKPLGPKLRFIVIADRKRVLLMRPMDDKSGASMLARSNDGITWNTLGEWDIKIKNVKQPVKWAITDLNVRKSGLLEFGTSQPDDPDSPPAATLFSEYLIYMPDHPDVSPCVLSLARTAQKAARDLNGKIEFAPQDMQSLMFEASVDTEGSGDITYYKYVFKRAGFASQEEYEGCLKLAERYKNYQGADEEGAVNEVTGSKTEAPKRGKDSDI